MDVSEWYSWAECCIRFRCSKGNTYNCSPYVTTGTFHVLHISGTYWKLYWIHHLLLSNPIFNRLNNFLTLIRWYRTDTLTYMFLNNWLISILSHMEIMNKSIIDLGSSHYISRDKIYNSQLMRNIFLKASVPYHRTLIFLTCEVWKSYPIYVHYEVSHIIATFSEMVAFHIYANTTISIIISVQ